MTQPPMRFLIDENVADEVSQWLRSRGYEVFSARDIFAPSTPDDVLAVAIELNGLIIVTHDRDFRQLRRTLPQGTRLTSGAGRITLGVREDRALRRLQEIWDVVEFSYARSLRLRQRFIISISQTTYLVTTSSGL